MGGAKSLVSRQLGKNFAFRVILTQIHAENNCCDGWMRRIIGVSIYSTLSYKKPDIHFEQAMASK